MDQITRPQARKNLVDLGVPPFALDIFDGKPLPHNWDIHFSEPYVLLDGSVNVQPHYGTGRFTPLWETCSGYELIAYCHESSHEGYVMFPLEGNGVPEITGMSWNHMLISHFQSICESQEPDDKIRELAHLLRFDHLDELIKRHPTMSNFDSSRDWQIAFLCDLGWHGKSNFPPPIPMDEFIKGIEPTITVVDKPENR